MAANVLPQFILKVPVTISILNVSQHLYNYLKFGLYDCLLRKLVANIRNYV